MNFVTVILSVQTCSQHCDTFPSTNTNGMDTPFGGKQGSRCTAGGPHLTSL